MKKSALALAYACALALPAMAQIAPSATCWTDATGNGLITIRFGYTNTSGSPIAIPVGADNYLSPNPAERGQPTFFASGTVTDAFLITVDAADASTTSWTVLGSTASVNLAVLPSCSSCFCLAGAQGVAGEQGPQGATGADGAQGTTGPEGTTGAQGAQGPIGPAGAQGPAGAVGATGPTGAVGPTGDVGPQGAIGAAGVQGPSGDAGPAGIDGAVGLQGPTGLAGPQGEAGDAGAAGDAGVAGEKGPRGPEGPIGMQGPTGPAGPAGARGVSGPRGARGEQGKRGAKGIAGDGSVVTSGATLLITGFVQARTTRDGGAVRIRVAGKRVGVDFPVAATGTWIAIPIGLETYVAGGSRDVKVEAAEGVELGQSTLSVIPLATGPSLKRRAAGHS